MMNYLLNGGFPSGLHFPLGLAVAVTVALAAVWFYTIWDCASNEKDVKIRNLWIAVLVVGKFLAAFMYFLMVMVPRLRGRAGEAR